MDSSDAGKTHNELTARKKLMKQRSPVGKAYVEFMAR
jgi:hypothetical protein